MGLSKTSFLHNGPFDNSMIMGGRVVLCKIRTQYSRCAPRRVAYHGSSCEPLQHRNCTTSPRVPNLSHAGHLGGSVLEALRSSQTSFQHEVVIRSSLRPFTRRQWNFRVPNSDFNLEVSKHHGPTGCPFIQLIMLEQCIMWQDGKTAKIQVVWHFILSRQTLGHGNG